MKKILKKSLALLISAVICVSSLYIQSFADEPDAAPINADGFLAPIDKNDASAVRITNADELAAIANDMYGTYVLMNDIDLSAYGNWTPIGKTLSSAFHGKFDGQGHKISNMSVNQSFDSGTLLAPCYSVGLFGVCDGAQIKNLFLENVNVSVSTTSGYSYDNSKIDSDGTVFAGAIAGYMRNDSVIYNCHISGSVEASASGEGCSPSVAGGLAGYTQSTVISYSYNHADVQAYNGNAVAAYNAYAGGLAGRIVFDGVIDRCYNSGEITSTTLDYGDSHAGGLAADASASTATITNCFNEGKVQSLSGNNFSDKAYAGGISAVFQGSIDKVYNSGVVTSQAKDPWGINNTTAYAGGICGNCASDSSISNSASVQTTVAATASSHKYQTRISNLGVKTNNISIDYITTGSVNDADITKSINEMKTVDVYTNQLGWDFATVWNMVAEKDFPQLMQVDASSDEYNNEYIAQHIAFINGSVYDDILNNYRWAQIYWSEENNFHSNMCGYFYTGVDKLVDVLSLKFADLIGENPYNAILTDYLSNQSVIEDAPQLYELKLSSVLEDHFEIFSDYIKDNWKSAWGELTDEDLFYIYYYDKRPSDEWINIEVWNHVSEIVYDTRHSGDGFEKVLGISAEAMDEILDQKDYLDLTISWFNGLIKYSANVAAYVEADNEFKLILQRMCVNLPEATLQEWREKGQLREAIERYTQYNDSENIVEKALLSYIDNPEEGDFKDHLKDFMNDKFRDWVEKNLPTKTVTALRVIGFFAENTWKISDYVTHNGDIEDCRQIMRANAYFEKAMYHTLRSIENDFVHAQTYENACLFDAAFKFFKETEIYSMDTVIVYLDKYQTSWVQAIRNLSNTFMNSAIEEVQINKLFLYNTNCHGTSYNVGGKVITVACPTNVFLFDENGDIAVSVDNDVVTYCRDGLQAYTSDSIKLITVPTDQNYQIRIDANDNGTMSYMVSEYSPEKQNVCSTVYSDIPIQNGNSFSGMINDQIQPAPETYNLIGDDNSVISEFDMVTEATNIPASEIKIEGTDKVMAVGDTSQLSATVSPSDATIKSVAWSSSDKSVISVTDTGTITALKDGTAVISCQSVYGGVIDTAEIFVLSDENDLLITKHPASNLYYQNDAAEPLSVEWYERNSAEVSVQWYETTSPDVAGTAVDGGTESTFTPSTAETGTKYYYAVINNGEQTRTSEIAHVSVLEEPLLASGTIDTDITWELTKGYALTISGNGALADKDSVEQLPWAQYQTNIKSITVSEGVTSLGRNVLSHMTSAKQICLPTSLEFIQSGALTGCDSLEKLTLPFIGTDRNDINTETSVLGSLFGNTSSGGVVQYFSLSGTDLTGLRYNIPASLTQVILTDAEQIPFGAFCNCVNLTDITVNEGIKIISGYSFYNCTGLKSIVIPDSVESVSEKSLYGCVNIEDISLPFVGAARDVNGTYDGALGFIFGRTSQSDSNYCVQYSVLNGDSLSGYGYAVPDALTHVSITDATHIPVGAFCNLTNMESVTLNADISSINEYAFYNCSKLADVYYQDWDIKWEQVEKKEGNNVLNSATIHYLETLSKLYGYSLSLDGAIGVDFFLELRPELLNSDSSIRFTHNGEQTDTHITQDNEVAVNGRTLYKFTYHVAAKEMTTEIKTQIISGDKQDVEYTYSVRDYAEYILNHTDIAEYAEAAPLVKAMLNYGAASQTYFGINLNDLANSILENDDKKVTPFSEDEQESFINKNIQKTSQISGVHFTYEGSQFILTSKTTYRMRFSAALDDYNVTYNGNVLHIEKSGNYRIVTIANIDPDKLFNDVTLTFTPNEGSPVDVTFSPTSYITLTLAQDDDNLTNVVTALYRYSEMAKAFKNLQN